MPLLYRSASAFFASSYRRGANSEQLLGDRPKLSQQVSDCASTVSGGMRHHQDRHVGSSDLIQTSKPLLAQAAPFYMSDEKGDADHEDTFEYCDVDDQAAEESESSVRLASYSLTVISSNLARSMLALATEEATTSSVSDDVDARAPTNAI